MGSAAALANTALYPELWTQPCPLGRGGGGRGDFGSRSPRPPSAGPQEEHSASATVQMPPSDSLPIIVLSFNLYLYLLIRHSVPGTMLGPGDAVVAETGKTPAQTELTPSGRGGWGRGGGEGGAGNTFITVWGSDVYHSHYACSVSREEN